MILFSFVGFNNIFCFQRQLKNLGKKMENGLRFLTGNDNTFNPYKRGYKSKNDGYSRLLKDVYDNNKEEKKKNKFLKELEKLGGDPSSYQDSTFSDNSNKKNVSYNSITPPPEEIIDNSEETVDNDPSIDTCEDALSIKDLNEMIKEEEQKNIEIFPGDKVTRKEVITVSRNI